MCKYAENMERTLIAVFEREVFVLFLYPYFTVIWEGVKQFFCIFFNRGTHNKKFCKVKTMTKDILSEGQKTKAGGGGAPTGPLPIGWGVKRTVKSGGGSCTKLRWTWSLSRIIKVPPPPRSFLCISVFKYAAIALLQRKKPQKKHGKRQMNSRVTIFRNEKVHYYFVINNMK